MCGLVLLFKISGYLSAIGESLERIKEITKLALDSMGSFGLCTAACSLPGSELLFNLAQDEMELGVGVHGEAGVQRIKLKPANEIVEIFLTHLLKNLNIQSGDEVVVAVNNLGALSHIEQWVIAGEIEKQLKERNIQVSRLYVGPIFTSLNMAGVQICLLKLTNSTRELFLKALDYPTDAPGWIWKPPNPNLQKIILKEEIKNENLIPRGASLDSKSAGFVKKCLINISIAMIANEKRLNELDSGCGDGDCGTTLRHLAQEIKKQAENNELMFENPTNLSNQLAIIAQKTMGGTSGAIYSLFFTAMGRELEKHQDFNNAKVLAKVWRAGIEGVKKYSVARIGDRTMVSIFFIISDWYRT